MSRAARPKRIRRQLASLGAAVSLVLACGVEAPDAEQPKAARLAATFESTATTESTTTDESACGLGAHARHVFSVGCAACHSCGGTYEIGEFTFPRGTSTAGGVIVRDSTGTSCFVGCHAPPGSEPTAISWSAPGPLACSSCHAVAPQEAEFRSGHAVAIPGSPLAERTGCGGCHSQQNHLSGIVRVKDGEGGYIDVTPDSPDQLISACKGCHDGAGEPIAGQTPPLLVGYDTTASGDFHGARAGTGFGGSLRPGFTRGQSALACTMCHSAHASANDFLVARTVNGFTIPAGVIDRAGVGAQFLCDSCHEGPRHDQCSGCHGVDPMPSGSPCFACHGHEGIVTFTLPWAAGQVIHADQRWSCEHCHGSAWMPALEYIPPRITTVVNVSGVSGSSATLSWGTDELASSHVEFGEGGLLNRVTGTPGYTTSHSVTVGGLAPGTTYSFRIRTSDRMRNVHLSPVQTFATMDPFGPPAPTIVPTPDVVACDSFANATFSWNPVTIANGDPVEYRVVVDDSSAFDSLVRDSGWIAGTTWSTGVALGPPVQWYWRVQARNAARDIPGPWSITDVFWVADLHYVTSCDDW